MKKLMLALTLGLTAVVSDFAGDVYDITMTCRVPEIKLGQQYYKDVGVQSYKGWMEVTGAWMLFWFMITLNTRHT